jgi:hypothetical protein
MELRIVAGFCNKKLSTKISRRPFDVAYLVRRGRKMGVDECTEANDWVPSCAECRTASAHKGLGEGGFVDGGNVNVEYRWARGDYGRLSKLAAELVQRRVTVLAATGGDASARAGKGGDCDYPGCLQYGR